MSAHALREAMQLIKEAAGDDAMISRDDARVLAEDLAATGRAVTAEAVEQLFQLADELEPDEGDRRVGHRLALIEGLAEASGRE